MTVFRLQHPRTRWATLYTSTGENGSQGNQGPQGFQGPLGIQGFQGPQGASSSSSSSTIAPPFGTVYIQSITASSNSGSAGNLIEPGSNKWWMSAIDSNNNEWVEYSFISPTMVTGVYLHCNTGREGSPTFQGYRDNEWSTITEMSVMDFTTSNEAGSSVIYIPIVDTYLYDKVRVISTPMPYLLYYQLTIFGISIQT